MMRLGIVVAGAAVALAGCAHDAVTGGAGASAVLRDAAGEQKAQATLSEGSGGIRVTVRATGMAPGTYGVHLHGVGRCDPPDFASAGPHWNPTGRQHGKDNPQGMHMGDLPNLVVGSDGSGTLEQKVPGSLRGTTPLLDADGAAVVIHAGPDDYRTDPSGNSGARVACGVIG